MSMKMTNIKNIFNVFNKCFVRDLNLSNLKPLLVASRKGREISFLLLDNYRLLYHLIILAPNII